MQEMQVPFLGQKDPLEKEMGTHSSILAWEVSCTEEPGRLQSMGSVTKSQTRLNNETTTATDNSEAWYNWNEFRGTKMKIALPLDMISCFF